MRRLEASTLQSAAATILGRLIKASPPSHLRGRAAFSGEDAEKDLATMGTIVPDRSNGLTVREGWVWSMRSRRAAIDHLPRPFRHSMKRGGSGR
jgi:hypothetical protein